MQQTLHVLLVDVAHGETMVMRHGSAWLLPIVSAPERLRAAPSLRQWAADHGTPGHVVGQWLGRAAATHDSVDWLVVISIAVGEFNPAAANLRRMPLSTMVSLHGCIEYQDWAIRKVMSQTDVPSVAGPFGTMTWPAAIATWCANAIGDRGDERCELTPLRVTPYEVTLEVKIAGRTLYFKGLAPERAQEAELTSRLSAIGPEFFPRTVRLETRPDATTWWLVDACDGTLLSSVATGERAAHVVNRYAAVQARVQRAWSPTDWPVATLDLPKLAAWAGELVGSCDRIDEACEQVARDDVPSSWVWADFDPANVIVSDDDVRFIDLDDSMRGPAPIAVATFARRMKGLGVACDQTLGRCYEQAWRPPLVIGNRWRAYEIVATLVECHRAWQRVTMKSERGEVYGLADVARQRLAERVRGVLENST